MIKYKVKARIAKNIGTDDFSFEEFEQTFEDKKSPIQARKKAYRYYESVIDIINDKYKFESEIDKIKKENHKTNIEDDKSKIKFIDALTKSASANTDAGFYIINDTKNGLFDAEKENMIIGYNHSIPNLTLAKNIEQEFKLYENNGWDTDNWTLRIKYWDYTGTYDDVYEPIVLFTPEDFWSNWNPDIAREDEEIIHEDEEEDSLLTNIIKQEENRKLELKSSLRYCYHKKSAQKYIEAEITKTIAAFANSEGGTLIVGVKDNGEVLGLENDFQTFRGNQKDKFLQHFANLIGSGFTEPIDALIKYSLDYIKNKSVFVVMVEKSAKPRFVKSKDGEIEFFIRRSSSSPKLNTENAVKYVIDKWHSNN